MAYNRKSLGNLKPGKGRQLGSKNKASKRVAEALKDMAEVNIDLFAMKMHQLSDKDFCSNYLKLMQLVVAQKSTINTDYENPVFNWEIVLASTVLDNQPKDITDNNE